MAEDFITQGNALFDKSATSYENYKLSGNMFVKALEADPSSYEAVWKASRSYGLYAYESKKKNTSTWKDDCKVYGKHGMKYGEKAIQLNADGVSVVTAIKEGLAEKTKNSFEKVYQINKMYDDGGTMKALGRYYFIMPWPMGDKKISLKYLTEFEKLFPVDPEGQVYLAETLIKTGSKSEARPLLKKAGDKYFSNLAKKLLDEIS
jgi:tetratricopeptide (TPR) repeat protein